MGALQLEREHYAAFAGETGRESRRLVRELVWPELRRVGRTLEPLLSQMAGHRLHSHLVFREAPVREALVVFSPRARDYEATARLSLAVSRSGVHVRVGLGVPLEETRNRLATQLRREAPDLGKRFRNLAGLRSYSATPPPSVGPEADLVLDDQFWRALGDSLHRAVTELDIGFGWSASRARTLAQIEIVTAFERLAPIYRVIGVPAEAPAPRPAPPPAAPRPARNAASRPARAAAAPSRPAPRTRRRPG